MGSKSNIIYIVIIFELIWVKFRSICNGTVQLVTGQSAKRYIYSCWVSMKRNKAPLRERMKELTVKVAI